MNANELQTILDRHVKWLNNDATGKRTDLRGANLSKANLRKANLRWADLSGADLSGANLNGVDFSGAFGNNFAIGYFGRHHAIAAGGYISIGCQRYTLQYWIDHGREIGENSEYTTLEIDLYMSWIELINKMFSNKEKTS